MNRFHKTFLDGPFQIFRNNIKNIIHGRFIEWIVFQTNFNDFELV